jgi:predicted metal-dependent hydrolase
MEQHHDGTVKRFNWLCERERFLNNLESLRQTASDMALKLSQLEKLYEEIQLNRADTHSLRAQINRTARQFDLQPIQQRRLRQWQGKKVQR